MCKCNVKTSCYGDKTKRQLTLYGGIEIERVERVATELPVSVLLFPLFGLFLALVSPEVGAAVCVWNVEQEDAL